MSDITKKIAEKIVVAAEDKKATDVRILDVEGISMVTDSFVICSANSDTQVKAIADHIEKELDQDGIKMLHKEGYREGRWVLMDFGTCITHIFVQEEREFYNLERLWGNEHPVHEED
ncbi:ribosome silencing factor [Pelosinus sp. sgz500959]|uniref:ribosome silencing factor n=1 Tax=Pelosinus sp. sgz500959 TaxID=3242472 RepID=UPI00366DA7E4